MYLHSTLCTETYLKGTLRDSKTQEALIGVIISIDSLNGTISDIDGKYTLTTEPGNYNITFSYIGYDNIY